MKGEPPRKARPHVLAGGEYDVHDLAYGQGIDIVRNKGLE